MNKRDQALRKARKSNNENDWISYRKLRNKCTNDLRSNNYHNKLKEHSNDPKKFWQIIKSVMPTKPKTTPRSERVIEYEEFKASDAQSKANLFCSFFSNVASSLKRKFIFLKDFIWKPSEIPSKLTEKRFRFKDVPKTFVEKELKKLKRNKATGIDGLPPALLKDSSASISEPLTFVINLSLKTATIPTEWKHALVTPIHKSGSSKKVDNYRPISVLQTLSKVLEKCVHGQLLKYLEENNLLSNYQFGYRQKRSTELAATMFMDNIRREIDKSKLVGAVFIDISKAFDTISHSTLLSKMAAYGINEAEKEWFCNYLFNRKQSVSYDDKYSDTECFLWCAAGFYIRPYIVFDFLQ